MVFCWFKIFLPLGRIAAYGVDRETGHKQIHMIGAKQILKRFQEDLQKSAFYPIAGVFSPASTPRP